MAILWCAPDPPALGRVGMTPATQSSRMAWSDRPSNGATCDGEHTSGSSIPPVARMMRQAFMERHPWIALPCVQDRGWSIVISVPLEHVVFLANPG